MNDQVAPPQGERRQRREQHPDQLCWIARARSLAATLDLLRQPLALLLPGEPIRVWHANAAARNRLSGHPELWIRDGQLMAAPVRAHALAQAVTHAQQLGPGHPQQLILPSRFGPAVATLQVLDFGVSPDLPISAVLLLQIREAASTEHGLQRLCGEFQLTRWEAESALGLYSMGCVEELAGCTGRSVQTVRALVEAAMQKTGAHTEGDLIAQVAERLNP